MSITQRRAWRGAAYGVLAATLLIPITAAAAPKSEAPLVTQALPHDPGLRLTAVEVVLAPGAKVASHHHAGTVFAYVLAGTVRSQLNGGEIVEYHPGQSWIEPSGTRHTLTANPSGSVPARFLATFVAPPGARLTSMEAP